MQRGAADEGQGRAARHAARHTLAPLPQPWPWPFVCAPRRRIGRPCDWALSARSVRVPFRCLDGRVHAGRPPEQSCERAQQAPPRPARLGGLSRGQDGRRAGLRCTSLCQYTWPGTSRVFTHGRNAAQHGVAIDTDRNTTSGGGSGGSGGSGCHEMKAREAGCADFLNTLRDDGLARRGPSTRHGQRRLYRCGV